MISFIVIGKNEGWKITKCINSIFDTIAYNRFADYEIIYVDSASNDDSIDRVLKFKHVKVFKLSGNLNAGIARNVGSQKSNGEVLFFIDGDMELQPKFLKLVYSEKNGLIHDFVSGNWRNYFYNTSNELIRKDNYKNMENDVYEKVTGGFFLINRDVWNLVEGINEKFKISEDTDLGLRLAKNGTFLLRKKEIGVVHHTIDYLDKKRMWSDFLSMNHLYGRSLLYRKHLFNKNMYHRMFRNDYTMLVFVFSLLSFIFSPLLGIACIIIYTLMIFRRGKLNARNIVYYLFRDITVILGLIIFFPRENLYQIEKIN